MTNHCVMVCYVVGGIEGFKNNFENKSGAGVSSGGMYETYSLVLGQHFISSVNIFCIFLYANSAFSRPFSQDVFSF